MNCILNILNNTFVGTLSAGILITILGFWLYSKQKEVDIAFDDLRELRKNAASLYSTIESASNKIEGLFNLYDGKNPQLTKTLCKLGDGFETTLIKKMSDGLVSLSNEINSLSENLITKIKIKNSFNVETRKITDNVLLMNFYLNGASFTLRKIKSTEVEEWREGWNRARGLIKKELSKILT